MNILFLCTGNSCRSILAEATFNALAPQGLRAMSAGSQPAGYVHPRSIALLAREGVPADGYYSKSWNDLPAVPDLVITVCSSAAGETCPAYLGNVMRAHWGVDDPAKAMGTDAEIDAAFLSAYRILRTRIEAFLALPQETLNDTQALQAALDSIGRLLPDQVSAIRNS
jgi:arsenate reductase